MKRKHEQSNMSETVKTGLGSVFNGYQFDFAPYALVSSKYYEQTANAQNVNKFFGEKGVSILFRPSSKMGFTTVSVKLPSGEELHFPIANKFLRELSQVFSKYQSSEEFPLAMLRAVKACEKTVLAGDNLEAKMIEVTQKFESQKLKNENMLGVQKVSMDYFG